MENRTGGDPRAEYARRAEARRAVVGRLERRHIAIGNTRLGVFAAAAIMAWLAFGRDLFSGWLLVIPAAVFIALAIVHERVLRARALALRSIAFYEAGIARLEHHWAGKGVGGERFEHAAHAYAEDLDLFGKGSLFELLCTTRLQSGEEALAGWLLAPADPAEVRARQQAIDELRHRLDLREDLALLGEERRSGIHPATLAAWSERPVLLRSRRARIGAFALSVLGVASVVFYASTGFLAPAILLAVLDVLMFMRYRRQVAKVTDAVGEPACGLALLAGVLDRFERETFRSAKLVGLRKNLETDGLPASQRIARLRRLTELLDSREHLIMRIIGPVLLWTTQLAFAIEAWREKSGGSVRKWLLAAGEIEALCALAAYAYEHPSDPFPELVEGGACFDAEAISHPLLPAARAVPNNVRLGDGACAWVVSGSNMSGKSTLLRTVGVNAVLAMAGAPVRAGRLRLSPLAVGASIRTLDSLQGGTSRFYAEIKRLHQIVELTKGNLPVVFLLDELLQGTNSHDRRIGAEAVVRSLVDRGAIGLLTTHDLALAHIADALALRAANVHFEDYLVDGRITFDYLLRPGIVRKSNALELMRSVGLEV